MGYPDSEALLRSPYSSSGTLRQVSPLGRSAERTFRGNRALSRYGFAADLNACLNQIERLIASSTTGFVRKFDFETLQRLVNEFRYDALKSL